MCIYDMDMENFTCCRLFPWCAVVLYCLPLPSILLACNHRPMGCLGWWYVQPLKLHASASNVSIGFILSYRGPQTVNKGCLTNYMSECEWWNFLHFIVRYDHIWVLFLLYVPFQEASNFRFSLQMGVFSDLQSASWMPKDILDIGMSCVSFSTNENAHLWRCVWDILYICCSILIVLLSRDTLLKRVTRVSETCWCK